jgi:hypothetical protein
LHAHQSVGRPAHTAPHASRPERIQLGGHAIDVATPGARQRDTTRRRALIVLGDGCLLLEGSHGVLAMREGSGEQRHRTPPTPVYTTGTRDRQRVRPWTARPAEYGSIFVTAWGARGAGFLPFPLRWVRRSRTVSREPRDPCPGRAAGRPLSRVSVQQPLELDVTPMPKIAGAASAAAAAVAACSGCRSVHTETSVSSCPSVLLPDCGRSDDISDRAE